MSATTPPLTVITLPVALTTALLPAAAHGVPGVKPSQLVSVVSHVPVRLGPFHVPGAAEAEPPMSARAVTAAMDVERM